MITLRWSQVPGADVASYRVYRSIVGFRATMAPLSTLSGKTLQLRMNGGPLQTFTFDGTTPIVDLINATITGGKAYASCDGASFFVRSNDRCDGSVEIVGGTALTDLGLSARIITAKSEEEMIAVVPAPSDPTEVVEYEDKDGVLEDWYRITSVNSFGVESQPTQYKQPIESSGPLCIIEGLVTDLRGIRLVDAEITATIQVPPERDHLSSFISKEPVTVYTNPDGRFSIALLQGALIRLEIPAIGYSRYITVPEKSYINIKDARVDLDYQFKSIPL